MTGFDIYPKNPFDSLCLAHLFEFLSGLFLGSFNRFAICPCFFCLVLLGELCFVLIIWRKTQWSLVRFAWCLDTKARLMQ